MAASTLFDRIKVSTATVGTGNIVVGAAQSTFINFVEGGVEEGDQISYLIEDNLGWEIGTGIYTASTGSFTRNVSRSSSANAAISLSGSAIVSLTALAADLATLDNSQTLTGKTLVSATITGSTVDSTTVGATTPASGAFTTLAASGAVSGTGFSNYLASPPAIGGTTPAAITGTAITGSTITANSAFAGAHNGTVGATTPNSGSFTTLAASSTVSGTGFSAYLASPPAIGGTAAAAITGTTITGTTITANTAFAGPINGTVGATTPASGAFTTLAASSTVSGTGFSTYLASPPAIGGTAAAAITGTTITANTGLVGPHNGTVGATTPSTGAFTTLSASSTVSGTGFSTYLASPPAIGGTAAAAGSFTTVTASTSMLSNGTGGVGYATGAGAAVTQLTSRTTTTPTTGAKPAGAITLFTATAVVGTYFSFTVPNTGIAVTDTVVLSVRGATNTYIAFVSAITAATSFQVTMASVAGTASDTPIVNFAIIKAVSA